MSTLLKRGWLQAALYVCVAIGLYGCTDDNNEDSCTTSNDCPFGQTCSAGKCAVIVAECDPEGDNTCGAGRYCTESFACAAGCGANSDCATGQACDVATHTCGQPKNCTKDSDCTDGYCAETGICRPLAGQCRFVGETCVPGTKTAAGFICFNNNTGDGPRCYERCQQRDVCTAAFNQNTGDPIYRYSREGACAQGSACEPNGLACIPSDCEGPIKGRATCDEKFPDTGGSCVQQSNGNPNYPNIKYSCIAGGLIEDGESCGSAGGIGGGGSCKAGSVCVSRVGLFSLGQQGGPQPFCARSCDSDIQCEVNERCVGNDEGTFGGAGICTERCDPFSVDVNQCSDGKKCFPMSSEDGICTDLIPPGPKLPYDFCDSDTACPSGTLCVSSQCMPQCDPTLPSQEERDATCPGGADQLEAYVKVLHLAAGAGKVDVYVDDVKVLDGFDFEAVGQNGRDWFKLKPGQHQIEVYADTDEAKASAALSTSVTLTGNQGYFISAVPGANAGVAAVVAEPLRAAPVFNNTEMFGALSVVHNVQGAGNVDVVAVAANADVTVADQTVLAEDFAFGGVAEFATIRAGSYDLYIFPTGAARTTLTAAATFKGVQLNANTAVEAVAYGSVSANNPVTPGLKFVAHQPFNFIPTSGGYCYNLAPGNDQDTTPSWGVCFQKCENGVDDYGKGVCNGDGNPTCRPFGSNISVCFNEGPAKGGEACGSVCQQTANGACAQAAPVDCAEGFFCDMTGADVPATVGAGTGVCRSYCTVGNVTNPDLEGCKGQEQCMPDSLEPGLGRCQLPCQPQAPGKFVDTSCPANQQTCRPDDRNYFCQASGDVAVGSQCAGGDADLSLDCAAGSLCVRNVAHPEAGLTAYINAFFDTEANETATCRALCRPFLPIGESDCPEDFGCMPIMPTQDLTRDVGVCMPKTTVVGDDCAELGKMCADGAICQENNRVYDTSLNQCVQSGTCLRFCDPTTKLGCMEGQRCRELGSQDQRSLVFGVFGLCEDL